MAPSYPTSPFFVFVRSHVKKGILPVILEELLKARKQAKKDIDLSDTELIFVRVAPRIGEFLFPLETVPTNWKNELLEITFHLVLHRTERYHPNTEKRKYKTVTQNSDPSDTT